MNALFSICIGESKIENLIKIYKSWILPGKLKDPKILIKYGSDLVWEKNLSTGSSLDSLLADMINKYNKEYLNKGYSCKIESGGLRLGYGKKDNQTILSFTYDEVSPTKFLSLVNNPTVLNYPQLLSSTMSFGKPGFVRTVTQEKILADIGFTYPKYGLASSWIRILPPEKIREFNFTNEILLNAPIYKAILLPQGCIYWQLTETVIIEKFDKNYYDANKKLDEYLMSNYK